MIPAYNSEHMIEDTLKSVEALDYPKKEVLVINDSNDGTPDICKKYGVRVVQNNERKGKANALNKLAKMAKGDIFFFIDSDTIVPKNCLNGLVPWFSKPDVGAVSPKWDVKNKTANTLTRLVSMENRFNETFFKIHMFFGSMVSFRGCSVMIKRKIFEQMGGWPNTLIEDSDMSAKILNAGYKIQYDPGITVLTAEPESIKEFGRQRFRWGKGSIFSFFHHYRTYSKNHQFLLYFLPYIFLLVALAGVFMWQSFLLALPFLSIYLIYSFTIKEAILLFVMFLIPVVSSAATAVAAGTVSHMAIMTAPSTSKSDHAKDIALVIPYVFFFVPTMMFYYIKGVISGIRDKRHKRNELDFGCW
jgi:cellulose synthase/poly-beta-1,6-N-acetylglucosamine synthase-like glycosyltransferase